MNNSNLNLVRSVSLEILKNIPSRSFFCLPLSALLYAYLKDNHSLDVKLVSGNLSYKGNFIFKQDFELSSGDHSEFKLWAGHAWVELEGTLWDLSFFRSLYSEKFNKPYKKELIEYFGEGREMLGISGRKIPEIDFEYHQIEILSDELATGIIQGIPQMLEMNW